VNAINCKGPKKFRLTKPKNYITNLTERDLQELKIEELREKERKKIQELIKSNNMNGSFTQGENLPSMQGNINY
jgi:hypothetical protein